MMPDMPAMEGGDMDGGDMDAPREGVAVGEMTSESAEEEPRM